ncbi:15-hydroxyprostaglandin dehydrogenase (NAD(+)) [Fonsecaea pedrosoi]|nr:15-hydroxyprostaglandin dehydrogenase (NAD(+)) [Fonsecaea pedrosoi]
MGSTEQQRVAILTGAATGMGHGVAVDLSRKGWKVVILDYNEQQGKAAAAEINADFYLVDVRSWKQQYEAFAAVIKEYGRVDFGASLPSPEDLMSGQKGQVTKRTRTVFGNAGRSDTVDDFDLENTTIDPTKPPNLEVLDINLYGASYTTILALHAFHRNPPAVKDCLLVLTSSGAGLYPAGVQPLYGAAKHGILGLARSVAWRYKNSRIRSCALVPGLVPTPIMPRSIIERQDKDIITPVSHIVTAVNDMIDSRRTGATCEASVNQLFYRDPPEYPDAAQRKVMEEVCDSMAEDFKRLRESTAAK